MKYITKYKSPNYNSRKKSKIQLIIIHYTALQNTREAISYLCDTEKKVSSHYLISQKGKVYNLVNEKSRAWHAGEAFWQGKEDINKISIGIELDYSLNGKNNKFSLPMMLSLKNLLKKIQKKYKISKNNILAHSDVSPYRKKDPGKKFPWKLLSSSNLILNFKKLNSSNLMIIEDWFNNHNIKLKKKKIILALSLIGYDTRKVYYDQKLYKRLIKSYSIRYLEDNDIINDKSIYDILITHLFNFMLTKN